MFTPEERPRGGKGARLVRHLGLGIENNALDLVRIGVREGRPIGLV